MIKNFKKKREFKEQKEIKEINPKTLHRCITGLMIGAIALNVLVFIPSKDKSALDVKNENIVTSIKSEEDSEFMKAISDDTAIKDTTSTKYLNGVWLTTTSNLDFPKTKGAEAQKEELISYLDFMKSNNITDVFFQIRPEGDTLYKSNINPWSSVLTGKQGTNPGYDPLAFILEEGKKRNINIHGWLNPYRVSKTSDSIESLSENHPARLNPGMTIKFNGKLFYNPASSDAVNHIVSTVEELVINYPELKSIHFDDYFYPDGYKSEVVKDSKEEDKMRDDVTNMIQKVYDTVKANSDTMEFGISPRGIYKNSETASVSSTPTRGAECYYADKADVKKWIELGIIDYVIPQIYWEIGHTAADYETLAKWWASVAKDTNIDLYIGHNTYKGTVITDLENQLNLNKKINVDANEQLIDGSVYFRFEYIFKNKDENGNTVSLQEPIKNAYLD